MDGEGGGEGQEDGEGGEEGEGEEVRTHPRSEEAGKVGRWEKTEGARCTRGGKRRVVMRSEHHHKRSGEEGRWCCEQR